MLTLENPEVKQKSVATHSGSASTMLGIWWKKKPNKDIRTIEVWLKVTQGLTEDSSSLGNSPNWTEFD